MNAADAASRAAQALTEAEKLAEDGFHESAAAGLVMVADGWTRLTAVLAANPAAEIHQQTAT